MAYVLMCYGVYEREACVSGEVKSGYCKWGERWLGRIKKRVRL